VAKIEEACKPLAILYFCKIDSNYKGKTKG